MNPLTIIARLLTICGIIFPLSGTPMPKDILQEAPISYHQGETATNYEERKQAFNRALFLYHTLEENTESNVNGLNQALGDTYFQLGEYSWATLYYEKALKNQPSNPLLLSRLEKVQKKLGLTPSSPIDQYILVALSKNFTLLFWMILLSFITLSCTIWLPFSWIRQLAAISSCLLLILLGNSLFFYYFSPLEGVLIKTTGLYLSPDWNQAQISNHPLLAGSKVEILQMTPDSNWVKITNDIHQVGYIPLSSLRPI
jgi:tetratricopeptide (TPR) repeat protein